MADAKVDKLIADHGLAGACAPASKIDELAVLDVLRRHMLPAAELEDLDAVYKTPEAHELVNLMLMATGDVVTDSLEGNVTTQTVLSWHMCRYQKFGKRAYVVLPALGRRLLVTSLSGIKGTDLRLPYPSIFVEVDKSLGFRVFNDATGYHDLYGFYLSRTVDGWGFLLCADRGEGQPVGDDALTHFRIPLDDRPPEASLADYRHRTLTREAHYLKGRGLGNVDVDELFDTWSAVFRWAMCLVHHVTHADAGTRTEYNGELARLVARRDRTQKNSRREKLNARIRTMPCREKIVVGHQVRADPRWPRSVGQAHILLKRTLVAGHWQRFAVGVGRQERVWKFREPFWRGQGDKGPSVHEVR